MKKFALVAFCAFGLVACGNKTPAQVGTATTNTINKVATTASTVVADGQLVCQAGPAFSVHVEHRHLAAHSCQGRDVQLRAVRLRHHQCAACRSSGWHCGDAGRRGAVSSYRSPKVLCASLLNTERGAHWSK